MAEQPDRLETLVRAAFDHGAGPAGVDAHAHDRARERVVASVRRRRAHRAGALGAAAAAMVALGLGVGQVVGSPTAPTRSASSPPPARGAKTTVGIASPPKHQTPAATGLPDYGTSSKTGGAVGRISPSAHAVTLTVGEVVTVTLPPPATRRGHWTAPVVTSTTPAYGAEVAVGVRDVKRVPTATGRGVSFEIVAVRPGTARVEASSLAVMTGGAPAPGVLPDQWVLSVTVTSGSAGAGNAQGGTP